MRVLISTVCFCIFVLGFSENLQAQPQMSNSSTPTTAVGGSRQPVKLNGQVRRVRVETANLLVKEGKMVEGPRVLREITTYDQMGQAIDSVFHPAEDGTVVGKKEYLYDPRGNIIEMVLRADDSSVLSKEKYDYQFDEFGNWKKMTASIAVYQNGSILYEPSAITYRTITYYYVQPAPRIITTPTVTPISNTSTTATVSDPAKTTKPLSNEPASVAATEIATSDAKKTSNADEASVGNLKDSSEPNPKPATDSAAPAASHYAKGSTFLASGRYAEAAEELRKATERDPNDAAAYAKLGIAYESLQQHQEAVAVFKRAIRIKPEIVDAEAYYQLSNAYSSLGKFSQALDAIKQAVYIKRAEEANPADGEANTSKYPTLAELQYSTGLTYYNQGRYNQAIDEMKQVIALNPKLKQAYYSLALAYLAVGDRKSAEKQQRTLESLDPVYAAKVAKMLLSLRSDHSVVGPRKSLVF